jgi:hypothetical protein
VSCSQVLECLSNCWEKICSRIQFLGRKSQCRNRGLVVVDTLRWPKWEVQSHQRSPGFFLHSFVIRQWQVLIKELGRFFPFCGSWSVVGAIISELLLGRRSAVH